MLIVVMGVAGSGKTRVGSMLAKALQCTFTDGDSLHPRSNVEKMSRGVPLTDADRAPWIAAIHARLAEALSSGESIVVSCSALKQSYRTVLAGGLPISWIYLKGSADLILSRLQLRTGHFMKVDMLPGQVEALEEPSDVIVADISRPPEEIVEQILGELPLYPDVRVFEDTSELSLRAAEAAVETIGKAVRAKGRCSLVLSGGSTPRTLHGLLASQFRDQIPWARVHLFWGDERYVSPDDGHSNYRMARETLLDHVPCPAANVHPMPTHFPDPDTAARDYEATLRSHFDSERPSFDLVFLGIGSDGHTASLFPGNPAVEERTRWVLPVTAPIEPPTRLTLTLPVLTRSAHTYFLVTGSGKARAVGRVLTGTADPSRYPPASIKRAVGKVIWWLDREAAAQLEGQGVAPIDG